MCAAPVLAVWSAPKPANASRELGGDAGKAHRWREVARQAKSRYQSTSALLAMPRRCGVRKSAISATT